MKKPFLIFLVINIFFIIQPKAKINNAIIIIDNSEDTSNIASAMNLNFSLAICNGYYPVIASNNLFYNFLNSQFGPIKETNKTRWQEKWDVYTNKQITFFLFVSKEYTANRKKLYPKNSEQLKKITLESEEEYEEFLNGFRLSNLTHLGSNIANIALNKSINVDDLKTFFVQTKDDVFGKWNIFLNGHGYYSASLLKQIEAGLLPEQLKTLSEDQFSDALIAGMPLNDFRNLIQFFINQINTNFLLYSTCFAGGFNIILPYINSLLNKEGVTRNTKSPNFTIVAGASTDAATPTSSLPNLVKCTACQNKQNFMCQTNIDSTLVMNFTDFFNTLNKYSADSMLPTKFKEKELIDSISKILIRFKAPQDPIGLASVPQVMLPGTENFSVINMYNNLTIITQKSLVKAKLEKEHIKSQDKDAILIYPSTVDLPINIEGSTIPIFNSMTPYITLHRIDTVNAKNFTLIEFLNNPILKLAFPKYFYINKFNSKDGEYKNLILMHKNKKVFALYTDANNNIYFYNAGVLSILPVKFKELNNNDLISSLVNYFIISKDPWALEIQKLFNFSLVQKLLPKPLSKQLIEAVKNLSQTLHTNNINEKIKNLMELIKEKIDNSSLQKYLYSLKIHLIQEYIRSKSEKYQLAAIAIILLEYFSNNKSFNEIDHNLPKDLQEKLKTLQDKVKESIDSKGIENYINSLKIQAIQEFLSNNADEYNLFAIQIYLLEYLLKKGNFTDLPKEADEKIVEFNEKIREQIESNGIEKYLENLKVHAMDEFIKSQEKLDEYNFFIIYLILLESIANKKLI